MKEPILAYIHIQKTAGTTIINLLRREFGLGHCDVFPIEHNSEDFFGTFFSANDLNMVKKIYPTLKSIAGHHVRPYSNLEDACPKIHYFTFLRDPIERMASYYQFFIQEMRRDITFDEWVDKQEFRNMQVQHLAGKQDINEAIKIVESKLFFIGILEKFESSLILFQDLIKPLWEIDIRISPKNVAKNNEIKHRLLNDRNRVQQMMQANLLDMELYRYANEVVFPKQLSQRTCVSSIRNNFNRKKSIFRKYSVIWNRLFRNLVYKPSVYVAKRNRS